MEYAEPMEANLFISDINIICKFININAIIIIFNIEINSNMSVNCPAFMLNY